MMNPQDLNRYAYVRNNPLLYRDPTGHCVKASGAVTDGDSSTICGVTTGGVWTGASNTVLYFAGVSHTEANPDPGGDRILDKRAAAIHDYLASIGYDANVMWVVADNMARTVSEAEGQIDSCNNFGTNCADLGNDFGTALAAYRTLTPGELSGYAHSHASFHLSIAFEQNKALADKVDRVVIAAGSAVDSDGGTVMGRGTVDVYVGRPVFKDPVSWRYDVGWGKKVASPTDIPGAIPFDTFFARHVDHLDPLHPAFAEAMGLIAGGGA